MLTIPIDELRKIPVFRGITDEHMDDLVGAFDKEVLDTGTILFEAGSEASEMYLLISGEITLREDDQERFHLHPPAPIGELGVLTGLPRNTTAVVASRAEVWRVCKSKLMQFFEDHGDVAFPFYHNLLQVVAEKLRRDDRRLEEMRTNIIRTQKAMKQMRDVVLESAENATSATIHDTLEELIGRNRRSNYVVEPTRSLTAMIKLDSGETLPILELSGVWLVFPCTASQNVQHQDHWSGVMKLPEYEIPVSGTVRTIDNGRVVVELDLLLDEYVGVLEDYLTRVQMLDVVV